MVCARSRLRYGMKVYSLVWTLRYPIICTMQTCLNECIEGDNACRIYFVLCVSNIKSILSWGHSLLFFFSFLRFLAMIVKLVYFILSSQSNCKYESLAIVMRKGRETMVSAVCLIMLCSLIYWFQELLNKIYQIYYKWCVHVGGQNKMVNMLIAILVNNKRVFWLTCAIFWDVINLWWQHWQIILPC